MSWLDRVVRWFVGILFIFSGLVKLNDPMGTAIKMEEYFEVFSSDISSVFHYLVPLSLQIGLFVVILEVLLGVAVIINFKMKWTLWLLLLLILFFTFLTFYSAKFNKVTDCGCFGDAIPLDPWQSFYKDIVLLILSIYLVVRIKYFVPIFNQKVSLATLAGVFLINVAIAYYALAHLPPIDFRPYKIGADIKALMQPSEEFRYQYVMEKEGEKLELESYPTDTSYKFIEMILLNPEAEPVITDFNVWNEDGDFTEETFTGNKLLIILNDVGKAQLEKIEEIKLLTDELGDQFDCWVLTANDEATYENFRHEYQIPLSYFYADGTVLKAMIRANPGLMLLKDGIVVGKWHNNDIPSSSKIIELSQ